MRKVCFVSVFNHKYNQNIPKLEQIYRDRFSDRYYLVPFCTPDEIEDELRARVIPVYENSHQFQGFFAQGLPRFYDDKFSHYIFCADDFVLNPRISQDNILDLLGIGERDAFIKNLASIADIYFVWLDLFHVCESLGTRGAECWRELPPVDEAVRRIERHGVDAKLRIPIQSARAWDGSLPALRSLFSVGLVRRFIRTVSTPLSYPLVAAYSDFFVVPAQAVRDFCHYCGVFASMRLFAEVATPTALCLACESIKTQSVPGEHWISTNFRADFPYRIDDQRRPEAHAAFEAVCGRRIPDLAKGYTEEIIGIHPVKLSRWTSE